jgi:hypothetical protein
VYVLSLSLSLSLSCLCLCENNSSNENCRGVNGAGGCFVTAILVFCNTNFGYICNSNIGYCAYEGREKRREQFLIMKKERKTAEKRERERERERESLLPARSLLPAAAAAAVSVVTLFLGPDLTNPLTFTDRHSLPTYLVLPTYQFPNDTHDVWS